MFDQCLRQAVRQKASQLLPRSSSSSSRKKHAPPLSLEPFRCWFLSEFKALPLAPTHFVAQAAASAILKLAASEGERVEVGSRALVRPPTAARSSTRASVGTLVCTEGPLARTVVCPERPAARTVVCTAWSHGRAVVCIEFGACSYCGLYCVGHSTKLGVWCYQDEAVRAVREGLGGAGEVSSPVFLRTYAIFLRTSAIFLRASAIFLRTSPICLRTSLSTYAHSLFAYAAPLCAYAAALSAYARTVLCPDLAWAMLLLLCAYTTPLRAYVSSL